MMLQATITTKLVTTRVSVKLSRRMIVKVNMRKLRTPQPLYPILRFIEKK
jgi:hypothetical protein